ncbi:hypothetical protein JB92DRAFT_3114496 [Gautieria morchelliformis]|nr:hypothetical protein JB92DRAFT_3114496 [Gautieria morchelliformis]
MAQALFDDHPIELYLRESGEVPELMPGGLNEFTREPSHDNVPYSLVARPPWLPRLLSAIQPVFECILTLFRKSSGASEFAERFKYIVISSPLLSSSLSSSSINRATTPTTPGHYHQSSPFHATTSPPTTVTGSQISTLTLAFLVPLALARGYYLSCILLVVAVIVLYDGSLGFLTPVRPCSREETWISTLNCLEELVAANKSWDNVVSETLGILENEEQSTAQPSSPSSFLPSLRTALSSTLHTTETQSDSVRQLLAALTSPIVLSQLSHMYAPPRPSLRSTTPKHSRPMSLATASPAHSPSNLQVRPLSLFNLPGDMYAHSQSAPSQTSLVDKRSTWNGSYMSLAGGSSLHPRRRHLSTIFPREDLKLPKTPAFSEAADLPHIPTASEGPSALEDVACDADAEDEPFGVTALELHRRRRGMRVPMLTMASPPSKITRSPSPDPLSRFPFSQGPPLTASFGSNFTSLSSVPSTSRHAHTQSLSNLHLALQGALGSKRFACAHLLALRFSDFSCNAQERVGSDVGEDMDGEDESYWEDVRSVISLLTSTLEDASARLTEAVADTMRRKQLEVEIITDEESCADSVLRERIEFSNSSFAPMPSHLARFAAHVDAITSALDDAREHLQQCVASLKEDAEVPSRHPGDSELPPVALQSYERLRRELGLALRECERGRGTLLEIVQPSTPDHLPEDEDEEDESPTRQDEHLSSGESDKTLYNFSEVHEPKATSVDHGQDHDPSFPDDDATSQLILTTSPQHLPSPGIEQVFESVSVAQPFVRERSKLTREERIRIAKARREGQFGSLGLVPESRAREPPPPRENWGPGGEVVQELKDVIWQVSERRRKMLERPPTLVLHPDGSHSPP